MSINYYLAPRTLENWKIAFANGNVWGLPVNRRQWRTLRKGDVVFFYEMSPIKAVMGYGSIVATFRAQVPIFTEEQLGVTEWPLRFRFEIRWPPVGPSRGPRISVEEVVDGRTRKKFHRLRHSDAQELLDRCDRADVNARKPV